MNGIPLSFMEFLCDRGLDSHERQKTEALSAWTTTTRQEATVISIHKEVEILVSIALARWLYEQES